MTYAASGISPLTAELVYRVEARCPKDRTLMGRLTVSGSEVQVTDFEARCPNIRHREIVQAVLSMTETVAENARAGIQ